MNYTEPHVPVPWDVIPKMLELAEVRPGEVVFDLGSGDGRILIAAARDFHAMAVGIEVRRRLVKQGRKTVKEMGLSRQVKVSIGNFKKVSLRKADVLALYLSSYTLNLLVPKFTRELRRGTRIVTYDYPILGWKAVREIEVLPSGWKKSHPIYLYVVQ